MGMTDKIYKLDVAKWRAHNCANCAKYITHPRKCDIRYELFWYDNSLGVRDWIAKRMGWREGEDVWDCPEKEAKNSPEIPDSSN